MTTTGIQCASCSTELEIPAASTPEEQDNSIRAEGWRGVAEGYADERGWTVYSYTCPSCLTTQRAEREARRSRCLACHEEIKTLAQSYQRCPRAGDGVTSHMVYQTHKHALHVAECDICKGAQS